MLAVAILMHMRVIEPGNKWLRKSKEQSKDRKSDKGHLMRFKPIVAAVIIVAVATTFSLARDHLKKNNPVSVSKKTKSSLATATDTSPPPPKTTIKIFSAQQFKELYDQTIYPNTQFITEPLQISGNRTADDHLRSLAEARGYKLRSLPVAPIFKIGDPNLKDDDLLQQKSLDGWHELQTAAKKAGLPLRIVSGYRSPEYQRNLFLARLSAKGVTISQVAAGQADQAVIDVLRTTAPPGYSRHHTGYTVDLQCDNGTLEAFVNSPCYTWISQTNYLNAKLYGWIPSYPAGAAQQGPEPEPWEYVWVGKDAVRQ